MKAIFTSTATTNRSVALLALCVTWGAAAGHASAQEFDRDAYREVATTCVEHLRAARTAIEGGDNDTALGELQAANDPCAAARNHLTPVIEAGTLPSRELETLRTDYVGQDSVFITVAAQVGLCTEAQGWLTEMSRIVPDVPDRVQERYIQAAQAVLTCVPSEVETTNTDLGNGVLDVMGQPSHGTFAVNTNFQPDPATYHGNAGGPIDMATAVTDCNGYVAAVPDFRVNYTAGTFPLRFYVDTADTDTTLAINAPDGNWYCNDDTVGLHPVVDFASPQSGQYDIYIGTYAQGQEPRVALYLTEIPNQFGPTGEASQATGAVDWSGAPAFGAHHLASGFQPDPASFPLTAGGNNQSSEAISTAMGSCFAGWVASVPDVRVNYTSGSLPLRFYVSTPNTDTTLAIHAPDGQWYCNDDHTGLHPALDFAAPLSGQYDVFVGTYSQSEFPEVNLLVTEMPNTNGPQ